jgi:hypothetical protein
MMCVFFMLEVPMSHIEVEYPGSYMLAERAWDDFPLVLARELELEIALL